jgi:nucleoside-diphosphate-sugar epimerase
MTRVLITGANSFVGSNFKKYSQCEAIDEVSLLSTEPGDIHFENYDVVLHLAAIVHQSKKISEQEYYKVNRDLCLSVAEHAKKSGVRHFVFLSTLKVYGKEGLSSFLRNEDSECYPDDFYGKSKYAAEVGLNDLADSNFTVSIIRTPLVNGEGVRANMMNLIRLVDSTPILPFGGLHNRRNYTFTENLVGYIDKIIEKQAPGVFIAMDREAVSTTELINCISKYLGKRVFLFKLPGLVLSFSRKIFPTNYERLFGSFEFENNKTRIILNYEPPFTSEAGLRKTIDHYLGSQKKKKHQLHQS